MTEPNIPQNLDASGAVPITPAAPVAPVTPAPTGAPVAPASPGTPATPVAGGLTHDTIGVTADQFAKFYSADTKEYNWQAHAKESEFKLAQKPVAPVTPAVSLTGTGAEQTAQSAGLDFDVLEQKIVARGDIDPSDYEALAKAGLPEATAKNFVRLMVDESVRHTDGVKVALGGEQGLKNVEAWARTNLTDDERQGYEDMLNSPQWSVAVDAIRSRMGQPPVSVQGTQIQTPNQASVPGGPGAPFVDQAAMSMAMRDPKYKTDPAYRADVAKRAAASNWQMQSRMHTTGMGA